MNRFAPLLISAALFAAVLCLVLARPALVRAQTGPNGGLCGMQYVNGQDLDYGPCINNGAPATPEPNLYTAFAMSAKTGAMGWSWRATSRAQAQEYALSSCRSSSGHPAVCRVLDWAENECLAFVRAAGDDWAIEAGMNPFEAANKSLASYRTAGGTNCAVVVVPCSEHPPQPLLPPANPMGNLRR